jgi:hypothetical protein
MVPQVPILIRGTCDANESEAAHLGLEGIRLILCQVRTAHGPEQLQLGFQQDGNQCKPGPLVDPVSSRGVNPTHE